MTIHYHGTPITPSRVLESLAGRCFCVSFYAPAQVQRCHEIGQSVLIDNGAFSAWRLKKIIDWRRYYVWVERWLAYHTTWAIIPDIIDGSEEANDALIAQWPHGQRGAPVWHMHESLGRLLRLAEKWARVCIGSSQRYSRVRSPAWYRRMDEAMAALCPNGWPPVWLHMLRGMALAGSDYPFASVDSTDIARNHHRPQNTAVAMANRWDARQCPRVWPWRSGGAFS